MKKLFFLLSLPLVLSACAVTIAPPAPHTDFAEVDCSEAPTDPVAVEWDWVVFDLPWCWVVRDLGSEESPLLVLKDQDGDGLVTLTYDPTEDPLDLKVTAIKPEGADTQIILNSFR